jgi:hypothetical protein
VREGESDDIGVGVSGEAMGRVLMEVMTLRSDESE